MLYSDVFLVRYLKGVTGFEIRGLLIIGGEFKIRRYGGMMRIIEGTFITCFRYGNTSLNLFLICINSVYVSHFAAAKITNWFL